MGLRFKDLESWQEWHASRRRLHVLKDRLTRRAAAPLEMRFWTRGDTQRLLVACDSNSPTNQHALLEPLSAAPDLPAVIAQPATVELRLGTAWTEVDAGDALGSIRAVASIGDHLGVGYWAHKMARENSWHQLVVQHGLLTPYSPPPPVGSAVLAWSDADAAFLAAGRADLRTVTVGSPLLHAASQHQAPHVSRFEKPVFLGQLHGAELSRAAMTRSVTKFWRLTGATYRPHPREEDKLSRAQHAVWRAMGMKIEAGGSLAEVLRPTVAAFSTGVLEAAARGIPAWVFHDRPPTWLSEMWARYGLAPWGGSPTRFVPPDTDPVQAIVEQLRSHS
ncbi:RNA-binding protein [Tessaracoccus sp. MC1679]|uniref:RNA-binding protein n=1 Tax=Tessaracoccus sp. MC1679 TaxID=2760313 RepID=UPI001601FD7F|nr:RNA-binding protein [Tessaracoccus sp. MC1679]MBB1517123.1 RNA-binding protein [Tessaracoccus sp. MC1679]